MKMWIEIILEWINCLHLLEENVKDLQDLKDGKFYKKLIELLSWKGAKDITDTENIVVQFLKDEFPKYEFDNIDLGEMEHIYVTSLFLLQTSQEPLFYNPMCTKLQHETQLKIKAFLEMIIPYGKNIKRETLRKIIVEIENDAPETPITPKTRTLKDFFTSPATWSVQNHKLINEKNRELRMLKAELEVERFEKADLQEDLRIQQNKVQNLQKILQEKTAEMKVMWEEKMKPNTPQSCKKNKDIVGYERYYKKEVDRLEDQLMQKQCEIDKLDTDKTILTKKLRCIEKQCIYFRETIENYAKALEDKQLQEEIKDRELVTLKVTNEELRTHLKELSNTVTEEQSFEIDGVVPLHSLSTSLNNSEILSSVVDIQLQEAKEESSLLKTELDTLHKKLESTSQKYENTIELLKEKMQVLQNSETKLNTTINKLTKEIECLQEKEESVINKNKNLEILYASQKESLAQVEKSKNALSTEINILKEKIKDLEKSLCIENVNNIKLNTELKQIKLQILENLEYIQDLTDAKNLCNTLENKCLNEKQTLEKAILHELETECINDNNINNKTITELIDYLRTMLCNFNKKYTSKQVKIQSLRNMIDEMKLKQENSQSQISKLKEKDEQNISEILKLKETIIESAAKINELNTIIEQNSKEITYLKQIENQKETLEKDVYEYKEEINKKNSLIQTSTIHIKTLKKNIQTFKAEFYLMRKNILNQISEYHKCNNETCKSVLDTYKILYTNYTKEQICKSKFKDQLANNSKELKDIKDLNTTFQNESIKNKQMINNLEIELINIKEKLMNSSKKFEKFEKTKEIFQKQHNDLKFEYEKVLFDLNNLNDKLKESQQKACEMSDQLKFKNEKIGSLTDEITSLKLEMKHIIHVKVEGETEMKNLIRKLETKVLEKQHYLDQLNVEVKLKQETLQLTQDKYEKLSKETITSEMKLKEVIVNLQEVRSNQEAVLITQEKTLKEKCLQLDQLQKELNESKETLCKQIKNEKFISQNVQCMNSELEIQLCKQNKMIEELQEMLKKERDEFNKNKEHYKAEVTKTLEIVQICEQLQHSVNDLRSTVLEANTNNENIYTDTTYDIQCINNDDNIQNILKTIRASINEIHASRKLILHLLNENSNLNETLKNQKIVVNNYVTKCEEIKSLKIEIEELNNLDEKRVKHVYALTKHKESLKHCLTNIIQSREELDISLNELKQKWDKLLINFQNIFITNKSVCDELKHIQTKKTYLENTLFKHHIYHFQNVKSLQAILWEKFLWFEQKLKDTNYLKAKNDQILDLLSSDVFSNEKTIIEVELSKNKILQEHIDQLQYEINDFSNLVTSFESNLESNEMKFQSESEKKLQLQIIKLTNDKRDLESKLNCLHTENAKLETDIDKLKNKIEEMKAASLIEVEDLNKELIQLKEENSKLLEEWNELNKRPKKKDVDNQLKDIHDKYKAKVDEIKQNMKTAYNEQITKLNREQEQCIQERLELLQKKMELQCRKQADELSKYKAHVAVMSSEFWNIGEKLLSEQQEKKKLQNKLTELRTKYQNLDKNIVFSPGHTNFKSILGENKEEVSHKIAVVQEKTTYEKTCHIRSIQTMGNAFNAEDEEGEVFDNIYLADMKDSNSSYNIDANRLSTLKKRNALCKPHLKTSYPAEMQFYPLPFTEEEIKTGSVPDEVFNDSLSQSLLPEQKAKKKDRTQTSYKKPGPPTPSKNGGRSSLQGNELRSPNSRILKERNRERATVTPRTLKSLFSLRRQDENVITPRGRRRSSIFSRYRGANNR